VKFASEKAKIKPNEDFKIIDTLQKKHRSVARDLCAPYCNAAI